MAHVSLHLNVLLLADPAYHFEGTGEHGVGVGKRQYLEPELGRETVELMRTIKKAIDPTDMMNPGKVCVFTCDRKKGLNIMTALPS